MDMETIKRINRDALKAAQEAQGHSSGGLDLGFLHLDNQSLLMYAVAVGAAVLTYYLLQMYSPELVTSVHNGERHFDQTRAALVSVAVGLLVVLGHHLMNQ